MARRTRIKHGIAANFFDEGAVCHFCHINPNSGWVEVEVRVYGRVQIGGEFYEFNQVVDLPLVAAQTLKAKETDP